MVTTRPDREKFFITSSTPARGRITTRRKRPKTRFRRFYDFGKRPKNLPHEPWMYRETDWGAFNVSDEEFKGDYLVTKWVGKQLHTKHDKPFFLACGIYRPHEPWFVTKKYFDMFPLDKVQLPPGVKEGDLDDVPPIGRRIGRNRYLAHIRKHGQWKKGVQAYLASIAYADAMVGRVSDDLQRSPHRDNTIVVLWGDHGWHLGEKEHWQKFTGWRVCARVPLIIRVPKGTPGLPEGTKAGGRCSRPVNLVDLFKTLNQLCGLPEKEGIFGNSLVPLLRNPDRKWPHAALTHLDEPSNYAVSTERWRYIHYSRGGEELYDIAADPYEWDNLAGKPEHATKLAELRSLAPKEMKPRRATGPDFSKVAPKRTLRWTDARAAKCPASKVSSLQTLVVLANARSRAVGIHWVDAEGRHRDYGKIPPGGRWRQSTYAGHAWLITDEQGKPLGHFVADKKPSLGIIPKE